ncbi:chromosome partitioning protein ParB [Pseudomonas aeruginosa]|uniref:ParB-like protein n=1 Tax=Pseudomonas aeruginosa group TaxID=136841 RepID=UPI00071B6937|nr:MULTISPECIES: ParB-like protein [Pseudomonas aeruginosa group]KSP84041.1 chromosome partitioning protein ParB [Pseudomonas aeruginosa]MCW8023202.1 chromosome partitioning protein ParB [Pseudomonas aeruginosa]RTT36983.1 chromosome partitioning protein ParB [Pseudomonas paraeruginosa]
MRPCLLFCCLFLACAAQAGECSSHSPVDSWCELPLAALHPTQQNVGLLQVEDEQAKLAGKKPKALERYLRKKEIPVVIGPDGRFYLTDRHHLSSALWRLEPTREVPVKVIGHLPRVGDFWEKMQENHWVWLHDARGAPIPPAALPNDLAGLGNDPYRALAGYAEDENAFDKDRRSYFIEFHWARYFGERMHWRPISRASLPGDLEEALRLACEPAAKELPGYRQDCPR